MKITIYELLGLIKDGKAPKKIMYKDKIWEFIQDDVDYKNDDTYLFEYLFTYITTSNLYYSVPNKIHNTKVLRGTLEQIIENQRNSKIKSMN